MKIAVLGLARSGKDTLSEHVSKTYGIDFKSSTYYIAEHIVFPELKDKYGYKNLKECFDDRVNHREEWAELVGEYNKQDYTKLTKGILSESDLYCGLRCEKQLEASRHLFDLVIWVDATERLGVTEDSSSITVSKDMADIIIENNADLDTFKGKIERLFDTWFLERKGLDERKKQFGVEVSRFVPKYGRELCLSFYAYWSEHSPNGRKMKFEKQKTFDISRRLATFARHEKKFSIANMVAGKRK